MQEFLLDHHKIIIIFLLCLLSYLGLFFVNNILKRVNRGFGNLTLKAFAICLLLPVIPIVCIIGEHTEAAFAILGTIAGYILSGNNDKRAPSIEENKNQQ